MIKLTLNPDGQADEYRADGTSCVLGPPDQDGVDCPVDSQIDGDWRVSIRVEDGRCILSSSVELDSITVDGFPFEELTLDERQGLLAIGAARILVEWSEGNSVAEAEVSSGSDIPESQLDIQAELAKLNEIFDADPSNSIDGDDLLTDEQLEQLMQEAAEIDLEAEEPKEPEVEKKEDEEPQVDHELGELSAEEIELVYDDQDVDDELEAKITQQHPVTHSAVQSDLEPVTSTDPVSKPVEHFEETLASSSADWRDLELKAEEIDDEAAERQPEDARPELQDDIHSDDYEETYARPVSRMRSVVMVVLAALIVTTLAGLFVGRRAKQAGAQNEHMAAIAVADLSMALLNAHGQGSLSSNQVLLHEDFLNDQLSKVIAAPYLETAPLLQSAEALFTAYDFKVYRDRSMERFVVLALPRGSSWLPFGASQSFVVSSDSMELRRLNNPSPWLKLLPDGSDLGEVDAARIATLELEEELVSLGNLDQGYLSHGFAPPKELSLRGSLGAHKVYNSPRYYPFTQRLQSTLSQYSEQRHDAQSKLQAEQELRKFARFPSLVVYTAEGSAQSDALQDLITAEWPTSNLYVGYVVIDPKSARVKEAELARPDGLDEEMSPELAGKELEETVTDPNSNPHIDTQHPLFVNLTELSQQRREALEQYSQPLIALLQSHNDQESQAFFDQHEKLVQYYIQTSERHRQKISQVLASLAREARASDPERGLERFLAYVDGAQLSAHLPAEFRSKEQGSPSSSADEGGRRIVRSRPKPRRIPALLAAIPKSQTLSDLHSLVEGIASRLDQDNSGLQDAERERYYAELRESTLEKVNELLLSPSDRRAADLFQADKRSVLAQILSNARVTEDEERNYYLREFDLLVGKYHKLSQHTVAELQEAHQQTTQMLDAAPDAHSDDRQELEETKQSLSVALEEGRRKMQVLEKTITAVPMDVATVSHDTQEKNSARLGQQILLQAANSQVGQERDDRLREAITLLAMGTEENRGLWSEILEARRLLTESPEQILADSIESDLGLRPSQATRPKELMRQMHEYIAALGSLADVHNDQQYKAQYRLFTQEQLPKLERIASEGQLLSQKAEAAAQSVNDYVDRLQTYSAAYQDAKKAGFFTANRSYHQSNVTKLKRKTARIRTLSREYRKRCRELFQLGKNYQQIAREEIHRIESGQAVESQHVNTLRRQLADIANLDPASPPLVDKLRQVIAMEVLPIPR